ncbi:hypothetical protein NL676_038882 [Syzygium grande]|nr:hypothetical protein NL676_038882 [Syzygium grande]
MDRVAYMSNDEVHMSATYLGGFLADVTGEFTGLMYHEMAHVWRWNGDWQALGGLIEGITNFLRLKSGIGGTRVTTSRRGFLTIAMASETVSWPS